MSYSGEGSAGGFVAGYSSGGGYGAWPQASSTPGQSTEAMYAAWAARGAAYASGGGVAVGGGV